MDLRIGIAKSNNIIEIELEDGTDRDQLKVQIDQVLADEGRILWLTDCKGKELAVPSSRISFVEVGTADAERRIGFGV